MGTTREWIEVDENGVGWEVEDYTAGPGFDLYDRNRHKRKQLPIVIANFQCPICGHKEFEAIYKTPSEPHFDLHTPIGPGSGSGGNDTWRIQRYRCLGCTVPFDSPAMFSKNKPAEVVPPVATEPPPLFELTEELKQSLANLRESLDNPDGVVVDHTS